MMDDNEDFIIAKEAISKAREESKGLVGLENGHVSIALKIKDKIDPKIFVLANAKSYPHNNKTKCPIWCFANTTEDTSRTFTYYRYTGRGDKRKTNQRFSYIHKGKTYNIAIQKWTISWNTDMGILSINDQFGYFPNQARIDDKRMILQNRFPICKNYNSMRPWKFEIHRDYPGLIMYKTERLKNERYRHGSDLIFPIESTLKHKFSVILSPTIERCGEYSKWIEKKKILCTKNGDKQPGEDWVSDYKELCP